jgi:hypothetical protein
MIFRELSSEEEVTFRVYAELNDPPDLDSWELYHPVCREVWTRRGVGPKGDGI